MDFEGPGSLVSLGLRAGEGGMVVESTVLEDRVVDDTSVFDVLWDRTAEVPRLSRLGAVACSVEDVLEAG